MIVFRNHISRCSAGVKVRDHFFAIAFTFGLLFRWLDKLGLAARYGYKVLLRQALFYGNYSLIGEDLEPNPVS